MPPLSGAGLRVVEVQHEGNSNASPEEAAVVADLVRNLLGRQWRNRDGQLAPISVEQIMVVTPYNAQIRAIQSAAAAAGLGAPPSRHGRQVPGPRSSGRHLLDGDLIRRRRAPRHGVPLRPASPQRRDLPRPALAIIVASPDLVRVSCQTPRQMHLANALCSAWEACK